MADGNESRDIKATDDYVARISKLLPAEITAAYLGIRTILSPEVHSYDFYLALFAVLILVIAPLFMFYVLSMRKINQIVFMLFSYVVWVANVEIERFTFHDQKILEFISRHVSGEYIKFAMESLVDPAFIKGFLVIWVLLAIPFIVKRHPHRE